MYDVTWFVWQMDFIYIYMCVCVCVCFNTFDYSHNPIIFCGPKLLYYVQ
jgi:hypothetical protein